jgi:uncharacterized membrane protein
MTSRSLKSLLVISIVVNIFLVGGIAGGVYRWKAAQESAQGSHPAPAPVSAQRGLRFVLQELAPPQRRAFRAALRDTRRDAAPLIEASREGRREVLRLLSAPELDRAAIDDALARTREADVGLRARIETTVVEYAATLPVDKRAELVDVLTHRPAQRRTEAGTPP